MLDLSKGTRAEYLGRQVFEKSPDLISIVGRDLRYQQVNLAFERRYGMPAETFIGKHKTDFIGADDFDRTARPYYDRCFAGEEVNYAAWFNHVGSFNPALGRRYIAVTYTPLRPDTERVEAALVIADEPPLHLLRDEPGEGPDHRADRNVDLGEDVRGHVDDGDDPHKEDQHRHHHERIRPA